MKFIICIPVDVKKQFDKATDDDLYGCYYDRHSIIGNAIKTARPFLESDDCINREDALVEISTWIATGEYEYPNAIEFLKRRMLMLQSVTPTERTGHWIDEGWYAEGHSEHAYRCSECEEHYIGYVGEYKHCPNCGAIMMESEE